MFFKKRRDKVSRCPNGHLLDPSWDSCPYCEGGFEASGDFIPAGDELDTSRSGQRSRPPEPARAPEPPPAPFMPPPARPAPAWPAAPAPSPPPPYRPAAPEPVRRIEHGPAVRPPVPEPIRRDPLGAPGAGSVDDDITVIGARPPAPPPAAPPVQAAPPPAYVPSSPSPGPAAFSEAPAGFANAGGPVDTDTTAILSSPVGRQEMVAWLVVVSGAQRGRDFRLTGGTLRVGSNPGCDIVIADDRFFSGRHAEVIFVGGQYVIRDLDSTNGSLVNDVRISEQTLRDGDRLQLGSTRFIFRCFQLPPAT